MTARTTGVAKVRDVLSTAEVQELTTASNASGARALITTWSIIAFAFALVAWLPHPLTVGAALILLGGRQLALAVLMHDASHRALFANRRVNDFAGVWLCGAPVWSSLYRYRRHHMAHHALAGSDADPDIGLVTAFPTTRASLARKLARDLFGDPQPRRGDQPEERAVDLWPQRALRPELASCAYETFHMLRREDKWRPPLWRVPPAGVFGWHLMALVFRMQIASKQNDRPEANAVCERARAPDPDPREDGTRADVHIPLVGGERSVVAQDGFGVPKLKTDSPAPGEVGIHCGHQHGAPSGHGRATCSRRRRSTLA